MSTVPAAPPQPFRYIIRVRYGECDGQGVVYNPKYGEYFDLAATEFLRAASATGNPFDGNFEFQVVRLLVEWTGPAGLDDVIEITVQATKFGNTSFTLRFEICKAGEAIPIVTGETVNVNVHRDGNAWIKRPLTEAQRERLLYAAAGKVIDQSGR
jgi:acyl-CoA thioester hydrolase